MNMTGRAHPAVNPRGCGRPGASFPSSSSSYGFPGAEYSVRSKPTDIQPGTRLPQPLSSQARSFLPGVPSYLTRSMGWYL